MLDTDPEETQRQLAQWAKGFADKAERFHAMRTQVEQVQVTESSTDGAVRVTVDSRGTLTDLVFTDKIRELAPPQIAAQVMACLRSAQQQLAPRVQDAMQATVGGAEPVVDNVVSGYRERFGENLNQPSTGSGPELLGVGAIEDDKPPEHNQQRRQYRAAPPGDEEYFADRDYLR